MGTEKAKPLTMRRSIGAARNPASHEAILVAAAAILDEAGYAGFSIEAVARRAKAGKPTIYRWWPSKAHLLLDVYQRQKGELPPVDTGTLMGDLRSFLQGIAKFWNNTAAGNVFRSLVAEAQTDESAASALSQYTSERLASTAAIFERARARGELRDGVDNLAVSNLLSAYAWKLLLTGRIGAAHDEIDQAAEIIARGVMK